MQSKITNNFKYFGILGIKPLDLLKVSLVTTNIKFYKGLKLEFFQKRIIGEKHPMFNRCSFKTKKWYNEHASLDDGLKTNVFQFSF